MATSGEEAINSSTSPENEDEHAYLCLPCQNDGKNLAAVGYCDTCKTFLCEWCYRCHTVPIPTRKHRMLDKERMLKKKAVKGDISQCEKHEDEVVLYHCPTHSFLGCHFCCFQHQKHCKDTRCISEILETINSSDEFKEFTTLLDCVAETSKSLVDECRRNIGKVGTCHTEANAAIKAFKAELLEAIDKLEKEFYQKTDTFKQKELSKLNTVVDKCLQVQADIENIIVEMEVLQKKNRNGDLYICMVKSKSKLLSLEAELNAAKDGNIAKPFNFEANTVLRETLQSSFGLGKLRIKQDIVKVEHMIDMNVKIQDDKQTCDITGSVVLSGYKLLISDQGNKKVKVIDTKQQKVLSAVTLPSGSYTLAKVTHNTVAATLPYEKKIVFIRTDPALSIDTEIGVNGACYGVAYSDRKLVVSFTIPHKVEIMDVKGSVLRRIQNDGNGQSLFDSPKHVAINPEGSLIYVSNFGGNNVVCLNFDGTVVATYKDNELTKPYQVIFDISGKVYVCGHSSNNVHQITTDCKKIKVLLTSADGLGALRTIGFVETEGKMYIGQYSNDIKIYRMIYGSL